MAEAEERGENHGKPGAGDFDMKAHIARRGHALSIKGPWDAIYREADDYVMPYRRPASAGEVTKRTAHLFDLTGTVSTFRGAGQLQQDLFPPGSPFFRLQPGPVAKLVAKANSDKRGVGDNGGPPIDELAGLERDLDSITSQITPFFLSGEWDNAVSELCLDLYKGTGVMLALKGDRSHPVRFVELPTDECALEPGPYGDVGALFWSTKMSRRAIKAAFPKGTYSEPFEKALETTPDDEIELCQDFVQYGKGWRMIVTLKERQEQDPPIAMQKYRTKPFIAARCYRVPGEVYGRGFALLALPTIKTLNKAMELTLKAAAIQMLGIWGYRPGGTFNPDTARLAPGQFWPMQATGGVMGADVVRLDVAAGKMDVSGIVLQELRTMVQAALHDQSLPEGGLTPKSAAEIMARMQRVKSNYVGAFGRMIHEIIPVIVPRVIEILFDLGLIVSQVKIDQLLVKLDVVSPLALALKADHHRTTVDAIMLCAQLEGPEGVKRRFDLDKLLPDMIKDLGVESKYVRSIQELMAFDEAAAKQMQAAQVAEAALKKPQEFANVMGGGEEAGAQAAPAM